MSDRLASLHQFVRVARTGSFSRAAKELSLSQPAVSRAISSLERSLGVELLTRTTRAVVLTTAGSEFLARIEPLLLSLDEAEQAVRDVRAIRGSLRIATPYSIALREIIPLLPGFRALYPLVRVELLMDDERRDLIREGVDIAIRIGTPPGDAMIARKIGKVERVIAASPGYLARAGTPKTPEELAAHAIVIGPVSESAPAWTFQRKKQTVTVPVTPIFRANANEGAIAAAVAGLGIISTGALGTRAELASGALVRILADWSLPASATVFVVLPTGRATKAAGRAFVDYLTEHWHL